MCPDLDDLYPLSPKMLSSVTDIRSTRDEQRRYEMTRDFLAHLVGEFTPNPVTVRAAVSWADMVLDALKERT